MIDSVFPQDLISYFMEHSRGIDNHNLVTTFMAPCNNDLTKAFEEVQKLADAKIEEFLSGVDSLVSFGPYDKEVREYVNGIGIWARGSDCWSFESDRYFEHDQMAKKHRVARLMPPSHGFMTLDMTSKGSKKFTR